MIKVSFKCLGNGNWTKIPCTVGSLFNLSISNTNCSSVIVLSKRIVSDITPTSSQAFCFDWTYNLLAGSSPTKITTSLGYGSNFANSAFSSFLILLLSIFPSSNI